MWMVGSMDSEVGYELPVGSYRYGKKNDHGLMRQHHGRHHPSSAAGEPSMHALTSSTNVKSTLNYYPSVTLRNVVMNVVLYAGC